MEPTTKKLRPYSLRLVTDVSRATGHVLVEQPTGSGKTLQIVTLVAMHLGQRFSHAVISAPQEQIEQVACHSPRQNDSRPFGTSSRGEAVYYNVAARLRGKRLRAYRRATRRKKR